MDSLFDMGGIANLALSVNNLEETRRRNDIAQQNSESEQGRLKVMQDRLAVDQQQAQQQHFASLLKLNDDPVVRSNPDLQNAVLAKIGEVSGFPKFQDPETFARGRETMRKTFRAMQANDPEAAKDGLTELAVMTSPDDFKKLVDSVKSFQDVRKNIEDVGLMRELQQERFNQLHDKQSKVNAGQIPYTRAAQEFSTILKDTDSKEFTQAMKFAESFKAKGSSVSKNIAALYSEGNIARFTGKEISQVGEFANQKASQFLDGANAAQQALDLLDHGGELPKGVTKADLRERALVGRNLSDSYTKLSTWANDPFDAAKLKDARSAFKTIDAQRKDMERLKETTQNEAIKIRQDAQSFRESEAYQKHLQFQRKTTAQNEFLAWMSKYPGQAMDKAAMAEAARIGMAYETPAEDVWNAVKNPNKSAVEVNNILPDKSKEAATIEAAKKFTDTTNDVFKSLQSAPSLLRNIEEAKALIPKAKAFMGTGGETLLEAAKFLNNRMGAKINTEGVKSAEELRTRIFFNIMENLKKLDAQPSQLQQQIMMDSLGKLGTDPTAMSGILDAYGDIIRDKVHAHNDIVRRAKKEGTVFPFDPTIELKDARSSKKSSESINPPKKESGTQSGSIAPYSDEGKESRYQKWLQEHPEYQ